jgi:hypothetical protein
MGQCLRAVAAACAVAVLTPTVARAQPAPDVASAADQSASSNAVDEPVPWPFWAGVGGGFVLLAFAWLPMIDFGLQVDALDRALANKQLALDGLVSCPGGEGSTISSACYDNAANGAKAHGRLDLGVSLALGLAGLGAVVASCVWLYPRSE